MVILVNYNDNYDTATTIANKSMGFDIISKIGQMNTNAMTRVTNFFLEIF